MNDSITVRRYWNELRQRGAGAAVSRWSFQGGTMPGYFHVLSVGESEIDIANPRRRIPRKLFEKQAAQWDGYKQGISARSELSLSSYSIYIISILQWLDQTRRTAGVGLSGGGDVTVGCEHEVGVLAGLHGNSLLGTLQSISAE